MAEIGFIWYYEDVATTRPVHGRFYTGRKAHVSIRFQISMYGCNNVAMDEVW